jgi:hypothetical protein
MGCDTLPRDLDAVIDGFADRQRGAGEAFAQTFAFYEFAGDVVDAILQAGVVEDHDVRVIQRRGGAAFLLEAADAAGSLANADGRTFSAT